MTDNKVTIRAELIHGGTADLTGTFRHVEGGTYEVVFDRCEIGGNYVLFRPLQLVAVSEDAWRPVQK